MLEPGAPGVVEAEEAELGGGPEDDLLARAGKVHHAGATAADEELDDEVPIGDRVHAVRRRGRRSRAAAATKAGSMGKLVPARAAAPRGQRLTRARQSASRSRSRCEHPEVSHQVLRRGDRLRQLRVGVPRHQRCHMRFGQPDQRLLQLAHLPLDPVDLFPQIEARVERHLVVAAAGGVQLPGERPDLLHQQPLDLGVNVLHVGIEGELAGAAGPARTLSSPASISRASSLERIPAAAEHADVRDAALEVVLGQPLIERQGLRELPRQLVWVLRQTSAPEPHAYLPPLPAAPIPRSGRTCPRAG